MPRCKGQGQRDCRGPSDQLRRLHFLWLPERRKTVPARNSGPSQLCSLFSVGSGVYTKSCQTMRQRRLPILPQATWQEDKPGSLDMERLPANSAVLSSGNMWAPALEEDVSILTCPCLCCASRLKVSQALHLPYLLLHPDFPIADTVSQQTHHSPAPHAGSSHFLGPDSFRPVMC